MVVGMKKPASKKPAAKKPASKRPASKKPAAKKPASKRPAPKKPASKKPASKRPAPPRAARVAPLARIAPPGGEGFHAAALGDALRAVVASPEAVAISRTAHFLDTGRVIESYERGGDFLLAEAFGRWAGRSAEILGVWLLGPEGWGAELDYVVARVGDAHFDAAGARTADELVAAWNDQGEREAWLGPITKGDAETNGISCEAGPLKALLALLRRVLGPAKAWGITPALAVNDPWEHVRVIAPRRDGGGRDSDVIVGALRGAGVAGVPDAGRAVTAEVRASAVPAVREALGRLQPPPEVHYSGFKEHRPGGRLPKSYRPPVDVDVDT